jgi:hypothetical protein
MGQKSRQQKSLRVIVADLAGSDPPRRAGNNGLTVLTQP